MPRRVAVDAGPLVAFFDRDDARHDQAVRFTRRIRCEYVSNLAVVTEVMHVLAFNPRAQADFLRWLVFSDMQLVEVAAADFARIAELMKKYADLPMDFTDATLVVLCERLGIHEIATIDSDFSIYRLDDRKPFQNIFETA